MNTFQILPCLHSYCLYAAISVGTTFIFVVTFFTACFALDQKRLESNRNGALPWIVHKDYEKNKCSQRNISKCVFEWVYSKIIFTWPGKVNFYNKLTFYLNQFNYVLVIHHFGYNHMFGI